MHRHKPINQLPGLLLQFTKETFQYYPEVLQSIILKYMKTMAQSVSDKVVQTENTDQEQPLSLLEFGNDIETNVEQNTSSLYLD